MLREQLDQAHLANQQLTEDLRRATIEIQQTREDFTQKSRNWKEEERVRFIKKIFFRFSFINLFRFLINIIIKNTILCMNYGVILFPFVNNLLN
jgi:hypothetical protein